jgi:CBS domain-containing protein
MPQPSDVLYVVDQHDTIETAMALIEQNRHRSVIVQDEHRMVVGTLSDGDIRKALLDHRLLSTPVHQVMNTNFIAMTPEEAHRAKAIFESGHIFLIPLVNDQGRLLRILKAH